MKPARLPIAFALVFGLGYAAAAQKDHVRVNSKEAPPRPGAPYNQGVMVGNLIWLGLALFVAYSKLVGVAA